MPTSGVVVILLILFMTGFQVIPLQHERNESVSLYPVSKSQIKDSFLKLVLAILLVQFFILYIALFTFTSNAKILSLAIGTLFVYVFVFFFISKRVTFL